MFTSNVSFFRSSLLVALLFVSIIAAGQSDNPVVTALQSQFGTVLIRDLEGYHEFTLSAPFSEIERVLNLVISQEWYPGYISISSRPDEKAAIIMRAGTVKNDSAQHFAALQQLVTPGMLPWKTGELNDKSPGVTAVETDFSAKVTILGQTLKSGLIFSQLFPMIERVQGVSAPFFERGSYSDSPAGRVMDFSVRCSW